jgi:hypothetical protein
MKIFAIVLITFTSSFSAAFDWEEAREKTMNAVIDGANAAETAIEQGKELSSDAYQGVLASKEHNDYILEEIKEQKRVVLDDFSAMSNSYSHIVEALALFTIQVPRSIRLKLHDLGSLMNKPEETREELVRQAVTYLPEGTRTFAGQAFGINLENACVMINFSSGRDAMVKGYRIEGLSPNSPAACDIIAAEIGLAPDEENAQRMRTTDVGRAITAAHLGASHKFVIVSIDKEGYPKFKPSFVRNTDVIASGSGLELYKLCESLPWHRRPIDGKNSEHWAINMIFNGLSFQVKYAADESM